MHFEHRFLCPLVNGLHARPASHLEALASQSPATVTLFNERTGAQANAKSVLSLVGADILPNDPLRLVVEGLEAEAAFARLVHFLDEEFAATDTPLPPVSISADSDAPLPRSLQAAAPEKILRGCVACRGFAEGSITQIGALRLSEKVASQLTRETDGLEVYRTAVAEVSASFASEIRTADGLHAEVLKAHHSLLGDVALAEAVASRFAKSGTSLAHAIIGATDEFANTLRQSSSVYLQERALDLQDVAARLLTQIYGPDAVERVPRLEIPALVIAESLTPGQFLALDRRFLRGLVLQHAGMTSHTIILARSFGVPTLTGVADATRLADGVPAFLDAQLGLLLPHPNEAVRRYYALEKRRIERIQSASRKFLHTPGTSRDGGRLPVLANVSSAEEVAAAIAQGAEGVGLFRTEMLYMDRNDPPDEEEQYAVYAAAATAAQGRPVTLRTFDIGGDKPVSYLQLPAEANPFLGFRGARIYEKFAGLLRTQLRAIFRASRHGSLRIMAPMIACPEEMRAFRRTVNEVQADFPGSTVPVGMMIEVPSVALAMADFVEDADFFSIGTNDLTQYFLAADRDNAAVASIYSSFHPAFLRLLRLVVDEAQKQDRPIGLCGELAENPEALPILLALGLDSISLGAPRILETKAALARLDHAKVREHFLTLLQSRDRASVEEKLQELRRQTQVKPQLDIALFSLESTATSKHEVIKELTDLLAADGRTDDSVALEEAVWKREEAYSTGFGYGLAIPHCQSDHVLSGSIAVIRLQNPVEWDSLDGQPVRIAILLAMRSADKGREHLRVFSKLSRLVMRDEFRESLAQAADADELLTLLSAELHPPSETPVIP